MVARLLMAVACCCATIPAAAQLSDDFSDGDFTTNPAWTGDADRWTVAPRLGDPALRSDGVAEADTIFLATPSAVSYGTWAFTFAHEGVNLSNFNGARVFLMADAADVTGDVFGYFVQLGTNNSDEVRLYRLDGDAASGRVELGRSAAPLLGGDSSAVEITVMRGEDDTWTVAVDGAEVLTAVDGTYRTSRFFGVWVKHSAPAAQGYFFDDIAVTGTTGPEDTTPPALTSIAVLNAQTLEVLFDEEIDLGTACDPARFEVSGGIGPPGVVACPPEAFAQVIPLLFDAPIPNGTYTLTARGLADAAGNVLDEGSLAFTVEIVTDTTPPALVSAEALDANAVLARFSEALRAASAGNPLNYEITPSVGFPVEAEILAASPSEVLLQLGPPLAPGVAYTLTARNIADAAGNVLDEGVVDFFFGDVGGTPLPGEVVVNEIFYDTPAAGDALEFVELFNRSNQPFDLGGFFLADDRGAPVPLTTLSKPLPPGGYAVLVRDAAAFQGAFPGVDFVEVNGWPALNNGGDAVVLSFGAAVIDSVAYQPEWGGQDVSLERRDPAGPSQAAVNWGSSVEPAGATPGAVNSIFAPDTRPPQPLFAEQQNENTLDLFFDEPLDPSFLLPAQFRLDGTAPTTLALLEDGTRLRLTFAAPLGDAEVAVESLRDLTGNVLASAALPLAYLPRPGDLLFNEVLYDPLADAFDARPDQPEYVEWVNAAGRQLSLRQLILAEAVDETGGFASQTLFDTLLAVPPGGFVVVYDDDASLADAFPETDFRAPDVVATAVGSVTSRGLRDEGEPLRLLARDSTLIDYVAYEPAWHNATIVHAASTEGFSLERITFSGLSDEATNWTTSTAPAGGTPGAVNSAFTAPDAPRAEAGLRIAPSPFFPGGTGEERTAVLAFTLEADAALVRARIFDASGRPVRTLDEARLTGRTGRLLWDGLDDAGRRLRIGIYVVLLEALDTAGGRAEAYKEAVVLARPLD